MIYNIQLLRAIATTTVIFVHLGPLLVIARSKGFGAEGVDLFFVISGFIMVNATQNNPPSSFDFFKNRIIRIVPIYWIMTLVVFLISFFMPNLFNSTNANIFELIKSLLFIPFMKKSGNVQPTLFVGWTLNYEMFFYALFSLSLAIKNYKVGVRALLIILSAIVLYGVLLKPTDLTIKFYTNPIMLEFALGMLLGLNTNLIPDKSSLALKLSISLIFVFALILLFIHLSIPTDASRLLQVGLPAMLVVGCAVILERWNIKVTHPFVMAIGNASYVIYLTHTFVTQFSQKIASHFHMTPALAVVFIIITVMMAFLVGIFMHKFIEKPATYWVRSVLNR